MDNLLKSSGREGEEVRVQGWIRTRRDSKAGLSFLAVHDGSCFDPIQVVAENHLHNYQSEVQRLTTGCAVDILGTIKPSEGKGQSIELLAAEVQVVGWVEDPDTYPMSPKRHTMEHLREHAHLRPRTNVSGAVARVRHCIAQAIHQFFHQNGFNYVHTPILTASDCEGAGELFRVSSLDMENLPRNEQGAIDFSKDFFGEESFLTVSGQLNAEAYCLALSKVYTFGPTFRAENSNTTRHLAEFWMVEPEVAFADLADIADLAEQVLKHVCKAVLSERADDMAFFTQRIDKEAISRLENIIEKAFARINYSDAIEILENCKEKFEFPISWGVDLASEHERYLAEVHFKKPVIVMNYPKDIKAFYMRMNDDGRTVAAMDVLAPGIGEIIGGAQREERLEKLDERMDEMNIPSAHLDWYRDLRRYGTVPHAGFGLGFDRLVSYLTGMSNIRDVIPFPRTPKNISF
ncbi:asparagine--tRNA ligase [Microbulbifer spongiae]|uniref:Asparagine--tRNA ligase n=1 Tax=Microbulbifer spongiae TaxID=2944933 RepID=A0ABY9EF97_9GAMM|nr:asparagine--tRNA ligase [Microbulbifer sp. MI-G]